MSAPPLDRRLAALARAAELGEGRLDAEPLDAARAVVQRAGQRLGLGVEHTVVALAGPTGAGKSTLFNALAGDDLVTAGRRRPTTSVATAAVWGEPPDALLTWLEVPRRHRVGGAAGPLDGLVLLDLPDFDSVETANRREVERVLALADLVVWVVDPQKYADAAWHEGYLRPLAGHAATMAVVLNQADLLAPDALAACRADLGRLLFDDGLGPLDVRPVSALTGAGLDDLRAV
ncbi:MAG TPA: GTPase, partial [Capillimicrobium sp.]